MNVLARKLRSFLSHARSPARLRSAVRRNLAIARGSWGAGGSFFYESSFGVRFVCIASSPTSLQLFVKGYQEQVEIELIRAWLRPGDSCLDVGANVGLLTAVFADAVGPSGLVAALEPSPITFARLSDAVRLLQLDNVVAIPCCASNTDGLTQFHLSNSPAAGAEEESMCVAGDRQGEFRRAIVPCLTLNRLCGEMPELDSPALLKIDVEGAEPLVLEGAGRLLDSSTPPLIVVEIHRIALANYGFTPQRVLETLPDQRFSKYFVPRSVSDELPDRRHGRLYPLKDVERLPIYSNVIAVPKEGWRSERAAALHEALHTRNGHVGSSR